MFLFVDKSTLVCARRSCISNLSIIKRDAQDDAICVILVVFIFAKNPTGAYTTRKKQKSWGWRVVCNSFFSSFHQVLCRVSKKMFGDYALLFHLGALSSVQWVSYVAIYVFYYIYIYVYSVSVWNAVFKLIFLFSRCRTFYDTIFFIIVENHHFYSIKFC